MKTLKQITLSLALIILTSGTTMAGSFKSIEVKLSNGKTLSILTKVEELVEESIPGYQYFVNQFRNRVAEPIAILAVYEEELLEEKTPSVSSLNTQPDMVNLNGLLAQIKPEATLLEEDIDTHEIFVQYQKEIQSSNDNVNIENFVKAEKELDEELPGTFFLNRVVK